MPRPSKMLTNLEIEQKRSTRYFERMTRVESNLASIRARLGMIGQTTCRTLQRIDDLQDMAGRWVQYTDALKRFDQEGELNHADTN